MKTNFIVFVFYTLSLALILGCKTNRVYQISESEVITETLFSENLSENRKLTIFLPKNYKAEKKLPIIYSTDGQIITNDYKRGIDSLIDNGIVPKFILVGVHSNENTIDNTENVFRSYEYIKDWSKKSNNPLLNQLYTKHLEFFSVEVIQYVEKNYPVSKKPKDRIFYGCSNGAGFGISMSMDRPLLFDNYICLSMAGGSYDDLNWSTEKYPNLVLAYGKKEPFPLVIEIDEFHDFLNSKNYKHSFYIFEGGHERERWKNEFLNQISLILKR